jgi:hypothetical protein
MKKRHRVSPVLDFGRALCSTDIYLRSVASFAFARSKALYDGFASHGHLPPRGL